MCMNNRPAYTPIPSFRVRPSPAVVPNPADLEAAARAGDAIRQWATDVLAGVKSTADLQEVLQKILIEVRRNREEQVRAIEPRWLKVDQARRYLGGMSETWIRDLEKVAPRELFRRVRGTVFLDRFVLDRIMEGDIELDEF
jgi:hypothetical protein